MIFIGADHRGFKMKEMLKTWLAGEGYEVFDCGNTRYDPLDDYPDFAFSVAQQVVSHPGALGVVICGSGAGISIAVNKVNGIRGALGITREQVVHTRGHDHINVLALSSDYSSDTQVKDMVSAFLTTAPSNEERFLRRITKITNEEEK